MLAVQLYKTLSSGLYLLIFLGFGFLLFQSSFLQVKFCTFPPFRLVALSLLPLVFFIIGLFFEGDRTVDIFGKRFHLVVNFMFEMTDFFWCPKLLNVVSALLRCFSSCCRVSTTFYNAAVLLRIVIAVHVGFAHISYVQNAGGVEDLCFSQSP